VGASPPNDVVHLEVLPPRGPSRGVAVFSPFWQVPGTWSLRAYTRQARDLGLHAVIYTPPEHLRRAPRGHFSGERILCWDFPWMQEMLRTATAELVSLCRGLQAPGRPVYLVGLSLGGLFAAMAAVGGAPVSGLALVTPAADVQVSMGTTRIGRRYRGMVERAGVRVPSDELLTCLAAPYRAETFRPPLEAGRVFLAQGLHDAIVPWSVASRLAERWEVPLRTYASGHMSLLFLQPRLLRDLRGFLRARVELDAPAGPPRGMAPRAWSRPGRAARVAVARLGRVAAGGQGRNTTVGRLRRGADPG
jgi:hypothetical protein